LKTQYGSSRISDKQEVIADLARDCVELTSEIITEKFDPVTMIQMSQTQLPTRSMQEEQVKQLQQQLLNQQKIMQVAQGAPQFQQAAQQQPQQMQELTQAAQTTLQSGQDTIKSITEKPSLDQVLKFLKDNRARAFVLDIETDSTIMPDENAEKQSRNEFVGVLAQLLPQLAQMIQVDADTADFCGELLKFATAPYRAGRALEGAIDDLVDKMKEKSSQPRGPDPSTLQSQTALQIEQMKDQRERARDQQDAQLKMQELQQKDAHAKLKIASDHQIELAKMQGRQQEDANKASMHQLDAAQSVQEHQARMTEIGADIMATRQKTALQMQTAQQAAMNKQHDFAQRAAERRAMLQQKMMQPRRPPAAPGGL